MSEPTDFDGAWKEALEGYLRPFLELCFPAVAEQIDWGAGITFLDKELQEVVRDADLGKQRVDKLVRVRRTDGEEEWVLLHIEVQAQPDEELPLRLYQYHHRLVDRYGQRCATLVILADEEEGWHPRRFESELWGCRVAFEFPTCKLVELATRVDLQTSPNVAAVVIGAHLAAQRARGGCRGPDGMEMEAHPPALRAWAWKEGRAGTLPAHRLADPFAGREGG